MRNLFKKVALGLALITGVTSFNYLSMTEAAFHNMYNTVEYLDISGEAEKQYIDNKVTDIYAGKISLPKESDYVVPEGWSVERSEFNNVPVEIYKTNSDNDKVMLFFHGGAYTLGLSNRYKDWAMYYGEAMKVSTILAVDYRIAPEYIFPSAIEDAENAYKGILKAGYAPEKIIVFGDSAGGHLATSLVQRINDEKLPMPRAMVLVSPWTSADFLPSVKNNSKTDIFLGEKNVKFHSKFNLTPLYFAGTSLKEAGASPLYGDLAGTPKTFISAGGSEMLLDDSLLYAEKAKAAGVDVTLKVYDGMSHDWTLVLPEIPESKALKDDIVSFVKALE